MTYGQYSDPGPVCAIAMAEVGIYLAAKDESQQVLKVSVHPSSMLSRPMCAQSSPASSGNMIFDMFATVTIITK